jgi:hypothetical protein
MTDMALADETWISATHAEVCLAFLRAEWEKVPEITGWHDRRLIDEPELQDRRENSLRRVILGSWREPLLAQIPAGTSWWRVRSLRHTHTIELLVRGGVLRRPFTSAICLAPARPSTSGHS